MYNKNIAILDTSPSSQRGKTNQIDGVQKRQGVISQGPLCCDDISVNGTELISFHELNFEDHLRVLFMLESDFKVLHHRSPGPIIYV